MRVDEFHGYEILIYNHEGERLLCYRPSALYIGTIGKGTFTLYYIYDDSNRRLVDAIPSREEATKVRDAINSILWLKERKA